MTSFKWPKRGGGGSTPVVPPTLFGQTGAVDTWYIGRLYDVDTYTAVTEKLGLTLTTKPATSAGYNLHGVPVQTSFNLKGLRGPCNNTNDRFWGMCAIDDLVDTSYDLLDSDSFRLVYQTKFETGTLSTTGACIMDLGSIGLTSGGIFVEMYTTSIYVYVQDDAAGLHVTRFIYPGGFTPWKDGVFYTWTWTFNKANPYGTVTVKAEGAGAVDYSADCFKQSGPDFSALDAITFSGKGAEMRLGGFQGGATGGLPVDFYQLAFAKNITYNPGTLP